MANAGQAALLRPFSSVSSHDANLMRILTCERSRFCLSQWSWPRLLRAYANSLTDQGAGFLSYKHKKATKDFFVVRSGQGDQCSVVQGEFSDKPTGAIGSAP